MHQLCLARRSTLQGDPSDSPRLSASSICSRHIICCRGSAADFITLLLQLHRYVTVYWTIDLDTTSQISSRCISAKQFLQERVAVGRAAQEVLITQGEPPDRMPMHEDERRTSREASSSRLPPGRKILSRYCWPRAGSRGSALKTVSAMQVSLSITGESRT